jgi:hypothetical protein
MSKDALELSDNMMTNSSSFEQEEIVRIFIGSMQEIMGEDDLQSILHSAGLEPFSGHETTSLVRSINAASFTNGWQTLIAEYGLRGAQGVILRSGQVFFKDFLRSHGLETGLMAREFRSLPKPRRIRKGLGMLAALQEDFIPGTKISICEQSGNWLWETRQCEWCGRQTDNRDALSKFTIGIIQEFLLWTSGGKCYPVQETREIETGLSFFAIRIQKEYID